MAASLKYLNPSTRYAEFFIDDETDLVTLPTINGAGTGNLSTVNGVMQGSKAILTNSDTTYYRIRGNNTWIKIETSGGGGGTGTNDYNALINKPSINGKTVEGNVTSDDIDVAPEAIVNGENLIFG